MFIITNRKISQKAGGFKIFKKTPNPTGPNELRLLELVNPQSDSKRFVLLDNKLNKQKVQEIKDEFNLDIDENKNHYASLEVASRIFKKARDEKKQILVFVHGYNNDMQDTVKKALKIESTYNVIVIIFSWPANGGGVIIGTASYLSDKADARASADAMNLFFKKLHHYHTIFTKAEIDKLWIKAHNKHKNNPEKAKMRYVELQRKLCNITINLLCHSMGNYVLKYATVPSDTQLTTPIFNNICLVAADTNNKNHKDWVEKIETRSNLYIVINKRDSALTASRIKPGKEQLARLGHYTKLLNAQNAIYVDVTKAKNVGSEHTYFTGIDNDKLEKLFLDMFEGKDAEDGLIYRTDNNSYKL